MKLIDLPNRYFVAKRDTVRIDGMQMFFAQNFGNMSKGMAENGIEMAGMPSALYYVWDEENMQADMAAAMPVASSDLNIEGFSTEQLDAGKAMLIEYLGNYEGIGAAHMVLEECAKDWGFEITEPVSEEYVTDPVAEPDTTKWLTKIVYPVVG